MISSTIMVTGRRLCPIASEAGSQADSWDVATSDVLYYSRRRYFPVQIVLAPAGCDGPQYWIHFYLPTGNLPTFVSKTWRVKHAGFTQNSSFVCSTHMFSVSVSWKRCIFLTLSLMSKQLSRFKFHFSRNMSFPHQNTSIPSIGRLHKKASMVFPYTQ
jgi:hypothetical protein